METGLSLWGIGTYVPEFRSRILPLARPCCTPNRLRLHRFVKPWRRPRGGESEHSQYRCLTADPSHPARGRFSGRVRQRYLNQLLSTGRTPLSIVSHDSGTPCSARKTTHRAAAGFRPRICPFGSWRWHARPWTAHRSKRSGGMRPGTITDAAGASARHPSEASV